MIRRAPRRDRWVTIDNDTIRDERLSWKARGLLAYLLSMPDNWTARTTDLARRGPEGEHAVRAGLKELETAGYLTREKVHQDDGTFAHFATVHERPICPDGSFPDVAEPDVENREVSSTQVRKTQERASASKGTRARNLHYDALTAVFGEPATKSETAFVAKHAHELKAAGATPEQIVERGRRMRARGGLWAEATPAALTKHWTALGRGEPRSVHDQVSGVER